MKAVLSRNRQGHNFPITFYEMGDDYVKFHNSYHGGFTTQDVTRFKNSIIDVYEVHYKGYQIANGHNILFPMQYDIVDQGSLSYNPERITAKGTIKRN